MTDPITGTSYSKEEYVEMHLLYGKHNRNALQASIEYNEKFGTNVKSSTIQDVNQRLIETGCVLPRKREVGMSIRRARDIETVEMMVEEEPTVSQRTIAARAGISKGSVQRAIHYVGLRCFHATPVQTLQDGDSARRLGLATWLVENEDKIDAILFSDESQFTRKTIINSRNFHVSRCAKIISILP